MHQTTESHHARWPSLCTSSLLAAAGAIGLLATSSSIASAQCCDGSKEVAKACGEKATVESTGLEATHNSIESRANTYTGNWQHGASVDADDAGNLLVTWASRRQEAGTYGVFAQRFDPLGRRLGTEIHVNQYVRAAQNDPATAFDATGNAWIVWESNTQDGDQSGIYLRRFGMIEDAFMPLNDELQVNGTTAGTQNNPAITIAKDGQALVTWTAKNANGSAQTFGRMFNADGEATSDEFAISSADLTATDLLASATALDNGNFVTVWARTDSNHEPAGIFARIVDATGQPVADEFMISSHCDGLIDIEPNVASAVDADTFAVSWLRERSEGEGYNVVAQLFESTGTAKGETMVVASGTTEWFSGAAVAMNNDGRFVVSYNIEGDKVTNPETNRPMAVATMFAHRFDKDGQAIGQRFQVNQFNDGAQMLPIASNANRVVWGMQNQLAFAWDGAIEGDGRGIGLTMFVPSTLEAPVPPTIEALAAASDLSYAEVAPPDFNPDWVPEEPVIDIAAEGPDFGFLSYQTTEWQPPDPDLAVGPDHVISVVNMRIKVHAKDGTELFHEYLEDFFSPVGASTFVFDPVAAYDQFADRFVVVAADHNGSIDMVHYAISKTSNPMDGWWLYGYNVDHIADFVDFENLGIGPDAYYLTADYFGNPGGNHIHMLEKAPMLSGTKPTMKYVRTSSGFLSLGSVTSYDAGQAAQYFASAHAGSNSQLGLYSITDPNGSPQLRSFMLSVPGFSDPPNANQKGSSNRLATIDVRIKHGVLRNGHLWTAHSIGQNSTARVRWYEIDMRGWPSSGNNPTLVQSGTFDDGSGQHSWFPDIGVDDEGDVVIVASRSSSNDFPYIARHVRKAGDPTGSFRDAVRLKESDGAHTGGRWGDYSGVDEDPAAHGTFWSHNEYNTTGTDWRTWVGRIDTDQALVFEDPGVLTRGQQSTFVTSNGTPGATSHLIYSFKGLDSKYVAALDVMIHLKNAKLAASTTNNANGVATLNLNVPAAAPVGTVHLQTVEKRNASNVIEGFIN